MYIYLLTFGYKRTIVEFFRIFFYLTKNFHLLLQLLIPTLYYLHGSFSFMRST